MGGKGKGQWAYERTIWVLGKGADKEMREAEADQVYPGRWIAANQSKSHPRRQVHHVP